MTDHSHSDPHPGEHGGHDARHAGDGHGLAKYVYVFVALCVLTAASFFTYSDFWRNTMPPQVGWAFMMAVSCTKAMLVILFFMHVKYEANWKYVLTIPPAIMSIFLMLALVPDVGMRSRRYSEERIQFMAQPAAGHSTAQHDTEAEHPGGPSPPPAH
jgi:cytochrome c oxidase subunit 4